MPVPIAWTIQSQTGSAASVHNLEDKLPAADNPGKRCPSITDILRGQIQRFLYIYMSFLSFNLNLLFLMNEQKKRRFSHNVEQQSPPDPWSEG